MKFRREIKIKISDAVKLVSAAPQSDTGNDSHSKVSANELTMETLLLKAPLKDDACLDIFLLFAKELMFLESDSDFDFAKDKILFTEDRKKCSLVCSKVQSLEEPKRRTDAAFVNRFGALLYEGLNGLAKMVSNAQPDNISQQNSSIRQRLIALAINCMRDAPKYRDIEQVHLELAEIKNSLDRARESRLKIERYVLICALLLSVILTASSFDEGAEPSTISYFFPLGKPGAWLYQFDANFQFHGPGADFRFAVDQESKSEAYHKKYPPNKLVNDIRDWRTGKILFHSDRALSHTSLLQKAVEAGACLKGADLRHIHGNGFIQNREIASKTKFAMKGLDLSGSLISDSIFHGVDFSKSIMKDATIQRTCFMESNLDNVKFDGSILESVSFGQAVNGLSLINTSFDGAQLTNVEIQPPNLQSNKTHFRKCRMKYVLGQSFEGTDLSGSNICHGHFRDADFRNANLQNVVFFRCDFVNAKFAGARHENIFVSGCKRGHNDIDLTEWTNAPSAWEVNRFAMPEDIKR